MTTPSPLSYASAQMGLRAPRITIVFDGGGDDWTYWARLAVHVASKVWGGAGFILVPHHDGAVSPILLQAARAYDPDHVILLRPSLRHIEACRPGLVTFTDTENPVTEERRRELVRLHGDEQLADPKGEEARALVASVCTPYRFRNTGGDGEWQEDEVFLHTDGIGRTLTLVSDVVGADRGGPLISAPPTWGGTLGPAIAARCGAVVEPEATMTTPIEQDDYSKVLWWLSRTAPVAPRALLHRDDASESVGEDEAHNAFGRTRHGLVEIVSGIRYPRPHLLVVGETANDFALAIAYDRTYGFGDWISPDWFSDITHINMKLMLRGYAPSGPDRADKVLVTTCSGQDAMLSTVAEALNNPIVRVVRDLADADPPPVATVTPRVTFDKDGRLHLGVVDQWSQSWAAPVIHVGDGTIIMETTCPIPSVLHPDLAASERLSWQIDVQFYPRKCPADRGIDQSALLVDNSGFFHTWVRSARDGISYQSLRFDFVAAGTPPQQRLATPKLRRPGLSEWVELVSAQRGLTVTPSAAGRQSAVLERLWGSRENLAFAMGGPIRTVLRAFLPTAVSSAEAYPNNEGVILAGEGFMTFDGMRSLGGEFEDERHLRVEVDEALMHRVLRRGLILRCAECGYSAFTPIDRLEQVNRCQRCDSPNELTHWHWKMPLHEPTWYYDLHRAVRGFLAQDGDVPLLLSHHLRTGRQHVADVGELEFLDADTGKKLAEADLIALVGQDVVVAEAKKNGSLGTGRQAGRAAAKRVELADVLSADQILLATTADSWDQGSVDALRSAVRGRRWTTGGAPTIRIVSGLGSNSVVDTVIDPPAPDAAVDH